VAGPLATAPVVVNRDPWHGHTYWLPENPVIVHASCVQVAVSAVNDSSPVLDTRNLPSALWTIAAEPTAANGDAASIVTDTLRPLTVADTELSADADPEDGDVGLPPPHAAIAPAAATAATWQA
jgi:hypothetical protein